MATDMKIKEKYFEGDERAKTWSGIPVKETYRPEDIQGIDYGRDLGEPGQYPYTRGVYPNMYRGRLWSRRLITGCSTPALTNERFKYLLDSGETAINMICDQPTQICLDPDHPMADGSVGRSGVPISNMNDMFVIMDGIPQDQVSAMLTALTPVAFPSYLALAERNGIPWDQLRGTCANRSFNPVCMYGGRKCFDEGSIDADLREFVKQAEWVATHVPRWVPTNFNAYVIRETGVTAAQEVAFVFAEAFQALRVGLESGADVGLIASRISFTFSAMIDIFEEAAKFRAARKIYAQTLKEIFGVKDPKALRLKMHVNTGGILMERPQAVINIARGAYAGLAAALGGCQSMQICGYDEAIAIPTEEAATIALRTEQILAYETGVTSVADPLAGSYYVESLTEQMEHEIRKILDEIDGLGGLAAAIKKGWMDQQIENAWLTRQQELEDKERIVVGVNDFTVPEEEDGAVPVYHHQVNQDLVEGYLRDFRELKRTRSQAKVQKALDEYRKAVEKEDEALLPYAMECCKAQVTTAELTGVHRMARGLSFDPYDMVEYPFN